MSIRTRPITGPSMSGPRPRHRSLRPALDRPATAASGVIDDVADPGSLWYRLVVFPIAGSVVGVVAVLVALNVLPPHVEAWLNDLPALARTGWRVSIPEIPGAIQLLAVIGINWWPLSRTVRQVMTYRNWHLDLSPPCPVCRGPMTEHTVAGIDGIRSLWRCAATTPDCHGVRVHFPADRLL